MGFAILRTQKLKHLASVRRSLKHAFREQDTPNADPQRLAENTHIGAQDAAEGMAKVEALLPEKRRKDAVLAIEYLVTASPEDLRGKSREAQDAYFRDALDWLRERHGARNVVYAGIHRDEHSPHLYAYAVPLDAATGRLNAKKWLGGAQALGAMQTEFAERVGRAHGLERGIEGSRARHQTIQQFYAGIEATPGPARITAEAIKPKVVEKGFLTSKVETPETIADRLTVAMQAHYAPHMTVAGNARADRKRVAELVATAKAQQVQIAKVQPLMELFRDLRPEQAQEVARVAREHQQRNRIEAEAQRRVDQLASLAKRAAGATLTFATRALDAIKAKAGEWRRVNWSEVENASVREAVHENRQSRVSAFRAVLEHSPGQAGAAKELVAATLERAEREDRAAGLQPEPPTRDRGLTR
jgi:hypothetical protein